MGKDSSIEWCHHTFNPWWGCTKVSAGCDHCYAETFDKRVGGAHWGQDAPRRTFGDKHWAEPLQWQTAALQAGERRRVFCASMADVFDAEAPVGLLDRLWALIRATPHLDWLLLTKRHGRIARSLPADWGTTGYPNVWLGVSVEDQAAADTRIPVLLRIPARVRFLSCEPLLGPVDLSRFHIGWSECVNCGKGWDPNEDYPLGSDRSCNECDGAIAIVGHHLHWIICGGESGPRSRPMHPDWARGLRDQCTAAGVAYLFKQWGEWVPEGAAPYFNPATALTLNRDGSTSPAARGPYPCGHRTMHRVGKHKAGRALDGRTWDEFPCA